MPKQPKRAKNLGRSIGRQIERGNFKPGKGSCPGNRTKRRLRGSK